MSLGIFDRIQWYVSRPPSEASDSRNGVKVDDWRKITKDVLRKTAIECKGCYCIRIEIPICGKIHAEIPRFDKTYDTEDLKMIEVKATRGRVSVEAIMQAIYAAYQMPLSAEERLRFTSAFYKDGTSSYSYDEITHGDNRLFRALGDNIIFGGFVPAKTPHTYRLVLCS